MCVHGNISSFACCGVDYCYLEAFLQTHIPHAAHVHLQVYEMLFSDGTPEHMQHVFDQLDQGHDGKVAYLDWSRRVNVRDVPRIVQSCRHKGPLAASALSEEELELFDAMMARLFECAQVADKVLALAVPPCRVTLVRMPFDTEHFCACGVPQNSAQHVRACLASMTVGTPPYLGLVHDQHLRSRQTSSGQ